MVEQQPAIHLRPGTQVRWVLAIRDTLQETAKQLHEMSEEAPVKGLPINNEWCF